MNVKPTRVQPRVLASGGTKVRHQGVGPRLILALPPLRRIGNERGEEKDFPKFPGGPLPYTSLSLPVPAFPLIFHHDCVGVGHLVSGPRRTGSGRMRRDKASLRKNHRTMKRG